MLGLIGPATLLLICALVLWLANRWARKDADRFVMEFRQRWPDKCFVCWYHRMGWLNGLTSVDSECPAHECVER